MTVYQQFYDRSGRVCGNQGLLKNVKGKKEINDTAQAI